ncbi:Cytochrome P450 4c3-like protein, partial [Leptotrombidium deliense]
FNRKCRKLKNLPQVKSHPILGNLESLMENVWERNVDLLGDRFVKNLCSIINDQRDNGVFLLWISIAPHVLVTNVQAVESLLSSQTIVEKSFEYEKMFQLWLGTGLITSGGEKWRSRRRFLTQAFHMRILNDYIPIMNKHFRYLVKKLRNEVGQPVDMVNYAKLAALDVICETAMGVCINAQSHPELKYVNCVTSLVDQMFNRFIDFMNWFDFIYFRLESGKKFIDTISCIRKFTLDVIEQRKKLFIEQRNNKNNEIDLDDIYLSMKRTKTSFMDLLLKRHFDEMTENGNSSFTIQDIREESLKKKIAITAHIIINAKEP